MSVPILDVKWYNKNMEPSILHFTPHWADPDEMVPVYNRPSLKKRVKVGEIRMQDLTHECKHIRTKFVQKPGETYKVAAYKFNIPKLGLEGWVSSI